MKKLLSLLLVLSLCLSSVILLASCTGKSAYEVAVENGFKGDEKAWLESLKGPAGEAGADGKNGKDGENGDPGNAGYTGDSAFEIVQAGGYRGTVQEWLASLYGKDGVNGKSPVVTVNEHGYWVINGVATLTKVDGSGAAVIDLELVEDTFTVVKGSATAPTLSINYKLDNDATGTIAIADSNVSPAIDFTKEGEQKVTITYSGFSKEVTVKIEGMMILFEDFSSLSDSSTMQEIFAATGFKIPCIGPDSTYKAAVVGQEEQVFANTVNTWYQPDGQDLSAYTMPGYWHRFNPFELSIKDGRLFFQPMTSNGINTADMSDTGLVLADDEYMTLAATGAYTVQMDFTFIAKSDNGTPDDDTDDIKGSFSADGGSQNIYLVIKSYPATGATTSNGRPNTVGAVFGSQFIEAAGHRTGGSHGVGLGHNDMKAASFETSATSKNILTTLFADSPLTSWLGETVTVKVVVKETTTTDFGYDVYIKKAGAPDTDFVLVGSANADTLYAAAVEDYLKENNNMLSLQHRSTCKQNGYYVDNIAVWTGTGAMPANTSTVSYEELNDAYIASLPAPEETPA